jgi:hypothetical protein
MAEEPLTFHLDAPLDDVALNALFAAAWPDHTLRPFGPLLAHSLATVVAYAGPRLVGFVRVAGTVAVAKPPLGASAAALAQASSRCPPPCIRIIAGGASGSDWGAGRRRPPPPGAGPGCSGL